MAFIGGIGPSELLVIFAIIFSVLGFFGFIGLVLWVIRTIAWRAGKDEKPGHEEKSSDP